MTVSTALKKRNFINKYCLKYYHYWGEGSPLANVLKEESIHWMIFVMLFMWSCCIDGVILCLPRLTDRQSDITLCESVASYHCLSCALSNVSLFGEQYENFWIFMSTKRTKPQWVRILKLSDGISHRMKVTYYKKSIDIRQMKLVFCNKSKKWSGKLNGVTYVKWVTQ